jgi:uncharacterized membrane protein
MERASGRRDAQDRADRIRIFRQELDALITGGVLSLTGEQRAAVDAHLDHQVADLTHRFDIDVSESQKQLSLGMRIVSALGGLALCAGVFLLFYRFWGLLGTPVQVGILIAAPLVGLAAMDFASRRERTLYFTALIGLVTFACFVLDLTVLGQLFNITSSPNAFLAWGAFALILAYIYGLCLPLAAGLICLIVFGAATLMSLTGAWWTGFWERPETILLPGVLIALAPLLMPPGKSDQFAGTYPLVGLLAVFAVILGLWHNGGASWLPFASKTVERIYQILAFLAATAVIWIGIHFDLRGTVNLGAAYFVICLYIKMVDWWWDWMPKYVFFFVVGAVAIVLLTAFRKLRERTA